MKNLSIAEAYDLVTNLRRQVGSAIFGQEELITETLCCLLAGGHILMTGAPGLAKTTLVRVLANFLGLKFGRVQFTPDLLPSDITGAEILNIDTDSGRRSFQFSHGPIFVNLLLADEINRASPRTQSALLEAMQERACTIGGKVYPLPLPFMVFATQNPFESEGTFPLPEAQMDRFLLHTLVEYPDMTAERAIIKAHVGDALVGEQQAQGFQTRDAGALDLSAVAAIIARAKQIPVEDELQQVVAELVRATRPEDRGCPADLREAIRYGAGPRAGISLISTARSLAMLSQHETVRWQHIRRMAKPVLRHRIRLTAQAGRDRWREDNIIDRLIQDLEQRYKSLAKGLG